MGKGHRPESQVDVRNREEGDDPMTTPTDGAQTLLPRRSSGLIDINLALAGTGVSRRRRAA